MSPTANRAPTMSIADIERFAPCDNFRDATLDKLRRFDAALARRYSAADGRAAGCTFNDIAWIVTMLATQSIEGERRVRMFLADCAVRALAEWEKAGLSEPGPFEAIKATQDWALGKIGVMRRVKASSSALMQGAMIATEHPKAFWAARAAWASGNDLNARALEAINAARALGEQEQDWQFDRLVEWFGDEWPEPLAVGGGVA